LGAIDRGAIMKIAKSPAMRRFRGLLGAATAIATIAATPQPVMAQDKAKIQAGEAAYNDYCSTCHGDKLVSTGQTFDLRRLTTQERPRFENSVLNGKNQMPPWKGAISLDQIDLLWHFIRANAYEK
jgi:mono/diheme cytochrome c family protein